MGKETCEKIARTSKAKKFSLEYQELGREACSGRVCLVKYFLDPGVSSAVVLSDAFALLGDISTVSAVGEGAVSVQAASPSLLTASWASAVPNNAEVKEKSINFMLVRRTYENCYPEIRGKAI
jgi:hypothetical protein